MDTISQRKKVVIAGGGNAGISLAAFLRRKASDLHIIVIEPSEYHYYQPAWTMVGGGIYPLEKTFRITKTLIPDGVEWIRDKVAAFDPENSHVVLASGKIETYDVLVVAVGIKLLWEQVQGLAETLGKNDVCSVYGYELAGYTRRCLENFRGGRALFTAPDTPVKCGGAPQKIMYLAADNFHRRGLSAHSSVEYWSGGTRVFGIEKYEKTLKKVIERYNITI